MIQGSKDNGKLITENTAITNSIKCRVCGIKPMQPPNHFPAEQFIKCPLCKKNICCFCISKCVECNRIFCKVCTVIK